MDDSLAEIEGVKTILPEVTAIQFQKQMEYEHFSCFNLRQGYDPEAIEKRTQTYQTNKFRNELEKGSKDYADYVRSLKVEVDIRRALPSELSRISELTQRTNKCTNGRRYTVKELKQRDKEPSTELYAVFVSDRFSDLGLVGAMEVKENCLTLFCLFCRALGREVEQEMLAQLLNERQIESVVFFETGKNAELQGFLEKNLEGNQLVRFC